LDVQAFHLGSFPVFCGNPLFCCCETAISPLQIGYTLTETQVGTSDMKTAIYIRVSTAGQNLEGQRQDIERWLTGNGIENVSWFVDKASGDNLDRPAFGKLQKAVFSGDVDTVVMWRLDRLSRKLVDGLTTLSNWLERGLRVVSVSQQFDFAGTTGKLIAAVLFAVAEMEQETRRERQATGIAAAKTRGVYEGRKQGSFKRSPRQARKLREKGLSLREIGKAMDCSAATVMRYLKTAA
jgi:DNA invertase Pin-like site-specific DNA recombinase